MRRLAPIFLILLLVMGTGCIETFKDVGYGILGGDPEPEPEPPTDTGLTGPAGPQTDCGEMNVTPGHWTTGEYTVADESMLTCFNQRAAACAPVKLTINDRSHLSGHQIIFVRTFEIWGMEDDKCAYYETANNYITGDYKDSACRLYMHEFELVPYKRTTSSRLDELKVTRPKDILIPERCGGDLLEYIEPEALRDYTGVPDTSCPKLIFQSLKSFCAEMVTVSCDVKEGMILSKNSMRTDGKYRVSKPFIYDCQLGTECLDEHIRVLGDGELTVSYTCKDDSTTLHFRLQEEGAPDAPPAEFVHDVDDKELAALIIPESEFPEGYRYLESIEMDVREVSDEVIQYGFEKGYIGIVSETEELSILDGFISYQVMFFPAGNASAYYDLQKAQDEETVAEDEDGAFELVDDRGIGEKSYMFSLNSTTGIMGYRMSFVKGNAYVTAASTGRTAKYAQAEEPAKNLESRL